MRIAVANWTSGVFGGVESYIATLAGALSGQGHDLILFTEQGAPVERPESAPAGGNIGVINVAESGRSEAIALLSRWHPDIVYVHQILDPELEALLGGIAPSVLFVHSYAGACISGRKTTSFPTMRACHRTFGAKCLLHYYPHRCGGWSPVTMASLFAVQKRRSALMRSYDLVLTQSEYMRREMSRYMNEDFLRTLALPTGDIIDPTRSRIWRKGEPVRLLFAGRMEDLKGGDLLLEALLLLDPGIAQSMEVTFAGAGSLREKWERKASQIMRLRPDVRIRFSGWLNDEAKAEAYRTHDLLVVPSIWPEPFGLVGIEAGSLGLPAAAFNVGGIPEWLHDGVSGHLAEADPATAKSLSSAIERCFESEAHYAILSAGARTIAARHGIDVHSARLIEMFDEVIARRRNEAAS